jgi:hypothetical protein
VALDRRPLLIDVGVGVYTRQTFGPQRYEIWTMQSSWHNVPEVDSIQQAAGRDHAARRVQGLLANPFQRDMVCARLVAEFSAQQFPYIDGNQFHCQEMTLLASRT